MWSYDDASRSPYDPEKAKEMLAAAGVQTPLDIDLWYQPVSRPYNPNGKRIGEMMQADLAKIGVNAKLVTFEWGEYRKRLQNAEDMTGRWVGRATTATPTTSSSCSAAPDGKPGQNKSRSGATRSSTTCSSRRALIADQGERAKLYTRMQEIEHDEAPELLLAHSVVYEAMRANVVGYKQSPFGTHTFEGVDLK